MGLFATKLRVWNPADPARIEELELWVDTGAGYSWVPRARLEALGIQPSGRMQFRTIEGRIVERDVAPVFVQADGHTGGDTVVLAEAGDLQLMGSHKLESLGLAAYPVQKKLTPTIGFALAARMGRQRRRSKIVEAIDAAIAQGRLREPFSNEDFRAECPGFGKGTYNAFLWKHRRGNPGGETEFFDSVGKNHFRRIRNLEQRMPAPPIGFEKVN